VSDRPKNVLLTTVAVIIFAEAALLAAATVYLIMGLLVARADSVPSAVALTILTLVATIWVALIGAHTLRGRPWIRGGAITWQVLQALVGVSEMQGATGNVLIGLLLIIPAVVVVVLLFTKPVVEATTRRADTPEEPIL